MRHAVQFMQPWHTKLQLILKCQWPLVGLTVLPCRVLLSVHAAPLNLKTDDYDISMKTLRHGFAHSNTSTTGPISLCPNWKWVSFVSRCVFVVHINCPTLHINPACSQVYTGTYWPGKRLRSINIQNRSQLPLYLLFLCARWKGKRNLPIRIIPFPCSKRPSSHSNKAIISWYPSSTLSWA